MDLKKYIESGILEDYVLGLTSDTDNKEIEQNLVKYPELQKELNQIEDALATYAQSKARPMPEGLSAQIMQSIDDLATQPTAQSDTSTSAAKPQATLSKGTNTLGIFLGLALAGALLGSYFLNTQKQDAQQQLAVSQTEKQELNDRFLAFQLDCEEKDGTILRLQEQIDIFRNPDYRPISLKGTDKAPNTESIVYFNAKENKSYFDIRNLPTAPSDKDYQLWAIVGGVPTDMGIVNLSNGLVKVDHIGDAQAFAVTLEARDGNPAPNLDELYVIGNV